MHWKYVRLEVSFGFKSTVASIACYFCFFIIRLCVHGLYVCPEVADVVKFLLTHLTFVGFDPTMDDYVVVVVHSGEKNLLTMITLVLKITNMGLLMPSETAPTAKLFYTFGAQKCAWWFDGPFLATVTQHMLAGWGHLGYHWLRRPRPHWWLAQPVLSHTTASKFCCLKRVFAAGRHSRVFHRERSHLEKVP